MAVALYLISLGISMIMSVRNAEKGEMLMTAGAKWISIQSSNIAAGMAATLLLGARQASHLASMLLQGRSAGSLGSTGAA